MKSPFTLAVRAWNQQGGVVLGLAQPSSTWDDKAFFAKFPGGGLPVGYDGARATQAVAEAVHRRAQTDASARYELVFGPQVGKAVPFKVASTQGPVRYVDVTGAYFPSTGRVIFDNVSRREVTLL